MKKEYMKPATKVVEIDMNVQVLAGSLTEVATEGLDIPIELPTDENPITGILWDAAR